MISKHHKIVVGLCLLNALCLVANSGCTTAYFAKHKQSPILAVWTCAIGGTTPVISGNNIFFGSLDKQLYAVDIIKGAKKWSYKTDGYVYSPIVENGVIYFGSTDACFYAVNIENGHVIWVFQAASSIVSPPAISGETIYFGTEEKGYLYGINKLTGKEVWRLPVEKGAGAPTVDDKTIYFSDSGYFKAVDITTRNIMWKHNVGLDHLPSPTIANGMIFFGGDDCLYAVDKYNGQVKWRFETTTYFKAGSPTRSKPVALGNNIYFGDLNSFFYAVNMETGEMMWKMETGAPIFSSPAFWKNNVYFGSCDQHLYAADVDTGQMKWMYRTNGYVYTPVIHDGTIYFSTSDNSLWKTQRKSNGRPGLGSSLHNTLYE